MAFPATRLRRLRRTSPLRDLVRETRLTPGDLVMPLFVEDGMLIRPAQDCASHYGSAIWLQRVDHLSETDYRETPLRRIGPEWHADNEATHTIARAGGFEIRDGQRRILRSRPA